MHVAAVEQVAVALCLFAAQIFLGAGINLDPVARIDEDGNLDADARFQPGRLGDVAHRVALGARLGAFILSLNIPLDIEL